MLILQDATYTHPNTDVLFSNVSISIPARAKVALIGNNGTGKSTLLKILAGKLTLQSGTLITGSEPYYVPQHYGQFDGLTVAGALGIEAKLAAFHAILNGEVTEGNLSVLADDWTIEERCRDAFAHWELDGIDLTQPVKTLSGGQKTKVFLAGIGIHNPQVVLLDEPGNHMDEKGRALLYDFIRSFAGTLVLVSHDRQLLGLPDTVYEVSPQGVTAYGGNYDFYLRQKATELEALEHAISSREKLLRKARETERKTMERQQKLDARGKKKQERSGLPSIMMNTLKNNAEKSTANIKGRHAEKIGGISEELGRLRASRTDPGKMKLDLDNSALHTGKVLIECERVNFGYGSLLWKDALSFTVRSGERIAVTGPNASGKSTLIRLMLGSLEPSEGIIRSVPVSYVYIDQDYSLIDNELTVYGQAQCFNSGALQEHDIKMRLNRFLFGADYWEKPCGALSGGEKMRLMLCALTIAGASPDIIVLDEPTNNLDIASTEILAQAVSSYEGTLIVISHDTHFLGDVGIQKFISL